MNMTTGVAGKSRGLGMEGLHGCTRPRPRLHLRQCPPPPLSEKYPGNADTEENHISPLPDEDQISTLSDEDRISALPDDVLSTILSFLTMKDYVKTSVLSKRWRYLCASLSNMDFDISTLFDWRNDGMECAYVKDGETYRRDTTRGRIKTNCVKNKRAFVKVEDCMKLMEIEINAINLTTFEFSDCRTKKLSFPCVPKLEKVSFSLDYDASFSRILGEVPMSLPQLESLCKSNCCNARNIKQLELYVGSDDRSDLVDVISPLLRVCPLLQKLNLVLPCPKRCGEGVNKSCLDISTLNLKKEYVGEGKFVSRNKNMNVEKIRKMVRDLLQENCLSENAEVIVL
ncbi:hypothetical protein Acr_00g0023910 [Actinidia rufa]|uniref:F-box domain-containing protein n=1 Tax=Actinidia rufa TaxID=165716 RepID=A0A7J0DCY7_9ERIC|nr:hypothetical protein Acr_00g0023910 [Actinidia rufa]